MNKKLFSWKALAGVALLAAISFTSCTSDTPIDGSTPSGVAPTTAGHQVGGDYDWQATVSSNKQLVEFFVADQAALKEAIAKKSKISICLNLNNYVLDGKEFAIPNFWGGANANGKVIDFIVNGTLKNADFERADVIKNGAKATKFPVVLNTKNLGGAEINFTFADQKFDLELATTTARCTFDGEYTIGYMKADAAEKLSCTEFKSGTVEGLDYASTGDFKGEIAGVWVRTTPGAAIEATANGIKVGTNASYTVFGKNVFVEANVTLDTWYKNAAGKNDICQLGTVKYVKAATVTLGGTNIAGEVVGMDAIESLVGYKAADCKLQTATTTVTTSWPLTFTPYDLVNIGSIEKVTVQNTLLYLLKDVYTDVVFDCDVEISTEDLTTIDNVEFKQDVTFEVAENNTALTFNKVLFPASTAGDVTITSGLQIENTVATTATKTYQWIIDDAAANKGHYEECKNDLSDLKEYNKDKEIGKFAYTLPAVKCVAAKDAGGVVTFSGDDAAAATKFNVIQIAITTPAGKITLIPEGVTVTLDKDCKFGGATTDAALNDVWGNNWLWDEQCWYTVSYADNEYTWKKAEAATTSGVMYVLVKK